MDGTRKCHPYWGNPITKEHKWYALTDKWKLAQKLKINKLQFKDLRNLKKKENWSGDALVPLKKEQNTHRSNDGDKLWSRDWRTGHPETALPGDSSYKQTPNPSTIMDNKKCILKGTCYDCPLRGPSKALHKQRQMPAANPRTGRGHILEELEGELEELKGFAAPRKNIFLATQTPEHSQGINNQSRGKHLCSQRCGRGIPCLASGEGEVLGLVKAQ